MRRREALTALVAAGLSGCNAGGVRRLIRDPQAAAEAKLAEYLANPKKFEKDFADITASISRLLGALKGRAEEEWGEKNAETPGTKRYVKYTEDYRNRVIVDFNNKLLRVETINQALPHQALEDALVVALLTPDDPESVDIFSAKPVTLGGRPYLYDLVHDDRGRPIDQKRQAERYARSFVTRYIKLRKLDDGRDVYYVDLALRPKAKEIQATKFEDIIRRNARRFGIDPALILAVIEVESAFNPFAVSSAPAFGLMQLVPSTGGRDAMRFVYKQDRDPTPNELFRTDRNIELGTAYLHMLTNQYLKSISNPLSRLYAAISAYNGGAANVFKVYGGKPEQAMRAMNRQSADQVYRALVDKHAFAETRNYLKKVVNAWERNRGMR